MKNWRTTFGVLVVLFTCFMLTGCNPDNTQATKGVVTLDGKPVGPGTITFYPSGGGRTGNGVIQNDGSFTVSYRKPGDGLPPSDYNVGVIVDKVRTGGEPELDPEDTINDGFVPSAKTGAVDHIVPARYNDAVKSPYKVTIESDGSASELEIELTSH